MHGDTFPHPAPPIDGTIEASAAERLRRAATAAQELSALLWDALHEELRADVTAGGGGHARSEELPGMAAGPRASRVAELSARLVEVASTLSSLGPSSRTAAASSIDSSSAAVDSSSAESPRSRSASADGSRAAAFEPRPSFVRERSFLRDPLPPLERPFERSAAPPAVVIVDERDDSPRPQHHLEPRPLPWDTPLSEELRVTRARGSGARGPA